MIVTTTLFPMFWSRSKGIILEVLRLALKLFRGIAWVIQIHRLIHSPLSFKNSDQRTDSALTQCVRRFAENKVEVI